MAEIVKTMGLVLKSAKHTIDGARLLDIFTLDLGKITAVIRGVEKPKAKLAAASQPFCFGEFSLAERGGFYTVTDCYIEDSFFSITSNLDKYVLGSSLLEVAGRVVQPAEKNAWLFTLLLKGLKAIAYDGAVPTAVATKFMMEVLSGSGFGFELDACSVCGKALAQEERVGLVYMGSGAVCKKHMESAENVGLSAKEWQLLGELNATSMEGIAALQPADLETQTSCLSLVLKQFYYRTGEKVQCLVKYL